MPYIRVKETENVEIAMRRFKRAVDKAGILSELRKREAYEKPAVKRKRRKAAARKRLMKQLEKTGMLVLMDPKNRRRKKRTTATAASTNPRDQKRSHGNSNNY